MRYSSFEKARRHRLIDNTIARLDSILNTDNHEYALISPAKAKIIRNLISKLVIPNVNHGEAFVPTKQSLDDPNYIPIWAINPGEEIRRVRAQSMLTPEQTQVVEQQLKNPAWKDGIRDHMGGFTVDLALGENVPYAHAVTQAATATFKARDDDRVHLLRGRPFVALNTQAPCPAVLAHELIHVSQYTSQPLRIYQNRGKMFDDSLSDEIDAYRVQADVIDEERFQSLGRSTKHRTKLIKNTPAAEIRSLSRYATFDADGNVVLDDVYRRYMTTRLTASNLSHISHKMIASNDERSQPLF